MRRCRKCYCTNQAACQACRSYYRGRVKNTLIIAFVMCVGAMLLGCILALLMIGVFSIIINQNEKLCWKQKQSIQAEICLNRSISKECGVGLRFFCCQF